MKIKFTLDQLAVLINTLSQQIKVEQVRKARNDFHIDRYIMLHVLATVITKLGKKSYEFKELYKIKLSHPEAAALLVGCAEALNTEKDPFSINTFRVIITQIEPNL